MRLSSRALGLLKSLAQVPDLLNVLLSAAARSAAASDRILARLDSLEHTRPIHMTATVLLIAKRLADSGGSFPGLRSGLDDLPGSVVLVDHFDAVTVQIPFEGEARAELEAPRPIAPGAWLVVLGPARLASVNVGTQRWDPCAPVCRIPIALQPGIRIRLRLTDPGG